MTINHGQVEIEEISSVLIPDERVSLDQAIQDAELAGFQVLEIDRANNRALITWYKKDRQGKG